MLKRTIKSWAIPQVDLGASCVVYLPLWRPSSDMTGSTIYSHDKYRRTCTVTNTTWGKYGRTFAGADLISIAHTADLNLGNFTAITWWYPTTLPPVGENKYIIAKRTVVGTKCNYSTYINNTGGTITFQAFIWDGVKSTSNVSTTTAAINTWYFLAFRRDTVADKIALFVNNTKEDEDTDTTEGVIYTDTALQIGADGVSAQYGIGIMGNVLIYNRALPDSELSRIYQSTQWRYK